MKDEYLKMRNIYPTIYEEYSPTNNLQINFFYPFKKKKKKCMPSNCGAYLDACIAMG